MATFDGNSMATSLYQNFIAVWLDRLTNVCNAIPINHRKKMKQNENICVT